MSEIFKLDGAPPVAGKELQLLTAGHEEWLTPPHIIRALGEFDLDPCAPIERPWPTASRHFTIRDNGLTKEWQGRVWMNPPYGNQTGKWLGRLAEHGNGVALVMARTETSMFFRHVWPVAHAIFFLRGRITFFKIDGSPGKANCGAPAVLLAYGASNAVALERSGLAGKYIALKPSA